MNRILLLTTIGFLFFGSLLPAQNVFNPADALIRYNSGAVSGSAENPDQGKAGLQKWVSTPTSGVSSGSGSYDASSYKAYYINYNGSKMAFRLKFPRSYSNPDSAAKKYPMMMFFHGAGEAGCPSNGGIYNNEKQLLHGGQLFKDRVDNNQFDGFLIYPQALAGAGCWSDWGIAPYSPYYQLFINVVDSLAKYSRADVDRLFVNGLSNGGKAAFSFTTVFPERIAAAGPSAAATSDNNYADFVHVPIWFASGGTDNNPTPGFAESTYTGIKNAGANITWTLFPGRGHAIWFDHWILPGYVNFMQDHHKANPHVFFQRSEFCPDSVINTKLGISPRYAAYEWQKDGTTLGATGNEITVNTYGTYRVRFKRFPTSNWGPWSPRPAVIKLKGATQTPAITITGKRSKVLPAPDGSRTVPLELPASFLSYQWVRANDNIVVSTQRTFNAPIGEYKAKTLEQFGCGSLFSPVFKVVDANGSPKPEPAKNLTALAESETSIRLDWSENPNPGTNETGFEIYRSVKAGGPYELIDITVPNVSTYLNSGLPSNKKYFYIVRAVSEWGAASNTNESSATSMLDNKPPTAPGNLLFRGSTLSTVDLAWTASTDDVAVDKYDVLVNGVKMYTSSTTNVTVAGLKPGLLYTFVVKARDAAGNLSAASNQESGYTHSQGINYKYYNGTWTVLPNFSTLTPSKPAGIMDNVTSGLGYRTQNDNYAFLWEGNIFIPVAGSYTFETESDDGSKLFIDVPYSSTATPLVNNDGVHGPQFRSGTVSLTRGYHSIAVSFFEGSGGEIMDVWWSGPGIAREKLPKNYLSTNSFSLPAVPANPTGLTGSAPQFNRVNLSWTHPGTNATAYEIVRSTSPTGTFVAAGTVPVGTNTFSDTSRNASTAYSYKVSAVNNSGTSAPSNTFTITTPAALAAPTAPTALSAILVAKTSVQLTWSDNSLNETGFEIERSVSNPANYRLLKTLSGGAGTQKTFTDTGLFSNVTYFYRVRAVGTSNSSIYTNQVNARTLNSKPEFVNPKDFTMKIRTTFILPVVVNDVDGDVLTITVTGLPTFGSLQTVSNGKVNLVFNASISSAGSYPMIMYVDDGNNGRDTAYFTMVVNQNSVPTMTSLSNISIQEGDFKTISLIANDQEGNANIFWYFTNKPSFVTFTNNGNGRGSLQVGPGYANSGIYNMTAFADDGYGAWTSSNFSIEVKEKDPNETIQVDFKHYTDTVPKWNNVEMRSLPIPFSVTNLKNSKDSSTGININALTGNYEGIASGAQSPSNTGIFPNNVMKDMIQWGFFTGGNQLDVQKLRVSGLNVTKRYNFIFFGSSDCTICGLTASSTTTYKIGSETAVVNFFQNITRTDTIYQVQPNASGEIFIDMIGDSDPGVGGVLNALVIEAQFNDGSRPVKPANLQGTFIDNYGVQLIWTDESYNENAFQVYRSTIKTGTYTLVNPGMNNKDSVSFTDLNTAPFTQYYYYVAGANNAGTGTSSDTISVLTGNNKPVIAGLNDLYVKTGGTISNDFTVSDNAGDVLTVSLVNKQSFLTLTALGGNNYRITATPTVDNIDWHKVSIKAEDNKGGITIRDIIITVADNTVRSVYVNFGYFGKVAPAPWNNVIGYGSAGTQLNALKDEVNATTGFGIQLVNGWQGITEIGHITGNESGVYPDAVLQSGIWDSSSTSRNLKFTGLDPAKRYNLVFVGSQNEGMNANTTFVSNGQTSTLNARYNTNKTANLNGLIPNASGDITVNITKGVANNIMFLNGLTIEEIVNPGVIMNPINLYLEPKDRTSIFLSWSDRSNNESGFTLQRATDSLFTVNLVTSPYSPNLTSTSITGLTPNTKYWFRVRPTNNTTGWSNKICTITPELMVYVNFNFTVANAPWPWNNTQSQPNLVSTFNNLIDQSGINSGISLKIEKVFNGEFNAGMSTGNNTGVVPDVVLQGNYWLDNGQQSQIRVTGLNQSKRYRFGFIGSSSPNGWYAGDYTATYTINGRTVYLNSWQNTTEIVYMGNVLADSNGEVLITFSTTSAALYGFNAGMLIEAYDDPRGGTVLNGQVVAPSEEVISLPGITAPGEITTEWKVNMYPNPFTDNLNIDFKNSDASNNLSVEVVDLAGKLVHRRVYGKLSEGYTTLRLNAIEGNMGTGVYFIILKVNGKPVRAGKLIRARQ